MAPMTALMTFALLAAPGVVNDVTYTQYFVSASTGSDATGEGTIELPWGTIGYALSQIPAGPVSPATLNVFAGYYPEVITVPAYVDVVGRSEKVNCSIALGDMCTEAKGIRTSASGTFVDLTSKSANPALVCSGTASPVFLRCGFLLSGFIPGPDDPGGGGGRIMDSASPTFIECVFWDNLGWWQPFGPSTHGGGVWHGSTSTARFVNCTFDRNEATHGGGIYAERGSIVCRDCVFTHNSASWGASIHATGDSSVTLINCRFTDNTVFEFNWIETFDLYLSGAGPFNTINCTLAGTRGTTEVAYVPGVIRNCIFRGPIVTVWGDRISYSNIEGYSGGVGNIDVEPEFVNAAEEDYRLLLSSPCIDMGTDVEAPDHDLDGNSRPVDIPGRGFDGVGQGYDMGCYEYVPPSPTPTPTVTPTPGPVDGDLTGDGRADAEDVFFFAQWWEHPRNETNYVADTNDDGHIDEIDLLWLTGAWR